jgi:predicted RNase H-like nuclease (RuvC/YqgF family)
MLSIGIKIITALMLLAGYICFLKLHSYKKKLVNIERDITILDQTISALENKLKQRERELNKLKYKIAFLSSKYGEHDAQKKVAHPVSQGSNL